MAISADVTCKGGGHKQKAIAYKNTALSRKKKLDLNFSTSGDDTQELQTSPARHPCDIDTISLQTQPCSHLTPRPSTHSPSTGHPPYSFPSDKQWTLRSIDRLQHHLSALITNLLLCQTPLICK